MGIFHSTDLMVAGEESGARTECRTVGAVDFGNSADDPDRVYWIPFESDGNTIFDTYTVYFGVTPTHPTTDQYRYVFAVYRQYEKSTDMATALGVGEIVPNTTLTGPTWTGNHSIRNTTSLSEPVVLLQGSYFIAVTFEAVSRLSGPLVITTLNGIDCNSAGFPWITESHLQGTLATPGTFPTLMTTSDAALSGMDHTFVWFDSFWAAIFYSGDTYP